nr:5-dehydro-4-deoxyglucarate dehydratase [Phytoactinopolyspora mesophila]
MSFPLTPFTADDAVDLDVLADHISQQVDAGPSALFVACGTGEFTALSLPEYREVVSTAVGVSAGRVPVFAGIGGGPKLAREFAVAAAQAGADGVLLLPPYLVACTPGGLLEHIRYVARSSTVPVVVYQRANAILDVPAAVALLDVPQVVGIKDGHGDVDLMTRLVTAIRTSGHPRGPDFAFFNGQPTAELSAYAYRAIGIAGYSSAVLAFAPDISVAFYRAFTEGDDDLAHRLLADFYVPLEQLRDKVRGYAVALPKAGARLAGLDVGRVRPPLVEPADEDVRALAAIIEQGRKVIG